MFPDLGDPDAEELSDPLVCGIVLHDFRRAAYLPASRNGGNAFFLLYGVHHDDRLLRPGQHVAGTALIISQHILFAILHTRA